MPNGPVEGHVNPLKPIKRRMYGRAEFVLLRPRRRRRDRTGDRRSLNDRNWR
jgi:transposase